MPTATTTTADRNKIPHFECRRLSQATRICGDDGVQIDIIALHKLKRQYAEVAGVARHSNVTDMSAPVDATLLATAVGIVVVFVVVIVVIIACDVRYDELLARFVEIEANEKRARLVQHQKQNT